MASEVFSDCVRKSQGSLFCGRSSLLHSSYSYPARVHHVGPMLTSQQNAVGSAYEVKRNASAGEAGLVLGADFWDMTRSNSSASRASDWGNLRQRESVLGDYKARRDPLKICKDILSFCPWLVEVRRATSIQLRHGILRVENHLLPSACHGPGSNSGSGRRGARRRRVPLFYGGPGGWSGVGSGVSRYGIPGKRLA